MTTEPEDGYRIVKSSLHDFLPDVTPQDLAGYTALFDQALGIFGNLSDPERCLSTICRNASIVSLKSGSLLQRQGQEADTTPLHLLLEGRLLVNHCYVNRGRRVVHVGTEDGEFGALVGEVEMLINNIPGLDRFGDLKEASRERAVSSHQAWADVVCETDSLLLRISPARVLLELEDIGLMTRLARILAIRVLRRNAVAERFILSHGQARDFVAKILLERVRDAKPSRDGRYRIEIKPSALARLAGVKQQNIHSLFGSSDPMERSGYFGRQGAGFVHEGKRSVLLMELEFVEWLAATHPLEDSVL